MFRKWKAKRTGRKEGLNWRITHEASGIMLYEGERLLRFAQEKAHEYHQANILSHNLRYDPDYIRAFVTTYTNSEVTVHNPNRQDVKEPSFDELYQPKYYPRD